MAASAPSNITSPVIPNTGRFTANHFQRDLKEIYEPTIAGLVTDLDGREIPVIGPEYIAL